jgi:UDP-glucose 4-epimerase
MFKDKRFLITGGAGLVGSHIADLLVRENAEEIIIIDNFTRGCLANLEWAVKNGNVTIIEGDIRDIDLLNNLMENIDVVFHQAAIRITQCAEEPRLAHEVLSTGTFNVLEVSVNKKVRKVIAASSASIYGLAEDYPTTEKHHPYANDTIYGASKVYLEGMLRSFHAMYGLDYIALRYFNVYGPRMDIYGKYTEVLIRWMDRIADGKKPIIFGDGFQTMDFVYIEDIAHANIFAAKSDITDEVFNIARGEEVSLRDLALTLLKVMDSDLDIEYAPAREVNSVSRRLADIEKAKSRLGFSALIGLEEGLRRLVAWWRQEKNHY